MKKKIIIDGKETNYSITDDAKIFNDTTGKELKGTYKTNEYHSVQLVIDGKPKTFMFHRLVAEAFCDNPNGYTIVDHIDRDKHNDNASNLRWVTSKENAQNRAENVKKTANKKYSGNFDGWKKVFGYPNYMINIDGTVVNTNTMNIMVPQDRHGYQRVSIDNSRKSVHILVWKSFNEQNVPEGKQIDHIDGDKSNNCLSNLRLVNSSDNMKNAYGNGHKGAVAIRQYTLDGKYLKTYDSIREAAAAIGVLEAAVKDASNRHGTCGGYYWIRESDNIAIEEVMYDWVPEGYTIIKDYPTYCINQEGLVYNKRNKQLTPIKTRADGSKFIIIKGKRINIKDLLP